VRVFGSIIVFGGTFADIVAAIVTMQPERKDTDVCEKVF